MSKEEMTLEDKVEKTQELLNYLNQYAEALERIECDNLSHPFGDLPNVMTAIHTEHINFVTGAHKKIQREIFDISDQIVELFKTK